jgi:hypothetical protein
MSLEGDAEFAGVSLGNGENPWVRPVKARN